MKKFNTTAVCIPSKHYMVDLTDRVREIKKMVDSGEYMCLNRARQYGKTTTLNALQLYLKSDYEVINLSFEGIGNAGFKNEQSFVKAFCRKIKRERRAGLSLPENVEKMFDDFLGRNEEKAELDELFDAMLEWCEESERGIVLIIDEVDAAANNQVFLDFLAGLRDSYISRDTKDMAAFQSVILAGVTDVKHLKGKIREEADARENSPWNIASDFTIDMSLSEDGIRGMLDEYEADHHTGMDTSAIAGQIRNYTSGYPFLVSRLCQILDERMMPESFESLSEVWTDVGVESAVKVLVVEKNTLFDSLMGKVRSYDRLRDQLKAILFRGEIIAYLPDNKEQEQLIMYGLIVNYRNTIAVANKIFEMRLYNYFIGESRYAEELRGDALDNKPEFIKGGELDVPLIMERFIRTQEYIRNLNDEEAEKKFIEDEGREKFLTYLSPIINGVGTFSVEDRNRDRGRMDVVIHYHGKRYIIEIKIWKGDRYNAKGEKQIINYLDAYGLDTGYLLSFNFNKTKKTGVEEIHIGGKTIYEGIV